MNGSGRGEPDNMIEFASEVSGTASGRPCPPTGSDTGDGTAPAIDAMWPSASERFRQRVAVIEDYVAEVALGNAESVDVTEAQDAAHKLAGTLGLFGLTGGSLRARELDEQLDDHPHYDPETVEHLAYLANAVRSDIERRSRTSNAGSAPSPTAEGVVVMIGGDNNRGESIRWLLGGRGIDVEDVDREAVVDLDPKAPGSIDSLIVPLLGLRRPRAVLVDLGDRLDPEQGVGTVDLVAGISASLSDCTIVVLVAADDLVTRKALLDAGASTVAGQGAEPGPVVEALLEGGDSPGPTVVVVGVDR